MQVNLALLNQMAIEAALKEKWHEAEELNEQILEKDSSNLDVKNRLARAYVYLGEFNKAKKILKEVLQADPINSVALKNLKLASGKKRERNHGGYADPKALIMEPGTTAEVKLVLIAKRITADSFSPGESLDVKMEKNIINFFKKGHSDILGSLNSELLKTIQMVKKQGGDISANFLNGNGKNIRVLIKSSISVFKSERQDVRPYVKKGTFEEPELELPEIDE